MSSVLDDPSLNVDPIPFDPAYDDGDEYGAGITNDDITAILRGLIKREGEQ